VNLFLPECQYLHRPKFTARIKQWGKTFALPEDAGTFVLEILKFLATVALIMETGLILLLWE
jgi:hypothetical protein